MLKAVGQWFTEGWQEICQIFGDGAREAPTETIPPRGLEAMTQLLTQVTSSGLLGPRERVALRVSLAEGLARQAGAGDKQAMEALFAVGSLADRM